MGRICKDICNIDYNAPQPFSNKYDRGYKYCTTCEKWFKTDEYICKCCKIILRSKSTRK